MKVTNVEKKEKSTVELTIEVDAAQFEAAVQAAYLKNRKRIAVPGFRKGKAPRKIIESMYGSGVFYEDAVNEVYPDVYEQAVEEEKLDTVGYPRITVLDAGKDGLRFTALVAVKPSVKLGQYKDLTAPKEEPTVTDADVEAELQPYITRATRLVTVERELREGDTAVIDFEGFDNGVPFSGGKGENYSLKLGSGAFVPGFEEQLVGMKAGEERELNITFPENYVPELAGKDVVFHVKVRQVQEAQTPEVDDEFAKDVSEFETLEEFKKDLGEKLLERRKQDADRAYREAILQQLSENMEAEIPDAMVEQQNERMLQNLSRQLSWQGMTLESYAAMMGGDVDGLSLSMQPAALRQVQVELALEAVAEAEGIEITEEEIAAEKQRLAEEYRMEMDELEKVLVMDSLVQELKLNKAGDLVVSYGKIGPLPEKKQEEPKESSEQEQTPEQAE